MTLILTDHAAAEIRNLVRRPDVPNDGGVRIASSGEGAVTLSLAAEPGADDTVIDEAGARVFLDPTAGRQLADLALDADQNPQGQVQFSLARQH